MDLRKIPAHKDGRVIIHFDYDCFYASVFESRDPSLKDLPFAVQQKQIIVTCNYEARRRGLHKLQLVTDARRTCPDVIIKLGEDLTQFRDASKELYNFLRQFSWNNRAERLGFDEVWLDITDIVNYNIEILNLNDLARSFFQTSASDPLQGFEYDATTVAGHTYPPTHAILNEDGDKNDAVALRLGLGSHFALHIRQQLEAEKGYTCTVGIATSKLLSKLVGNLNKPKGQTTLMPSASSTDGIDSNIASFIDGHDIGKIPGIGFKLSQLLRRAVLEREADFDAGLVYGGTLEKVTVADVRKHPGINPRMLQQLLGGPGSSHEIGYKIWCLLHGVDDTEVGQARAIPRQISIEDSYIRLDTMSELLKELTHLSRSLLKRMRTDLLGDDDDNTESDETGEEQESTNNTTLPSVSTSKKWLAHPKTIRLSTRPRQPLQPDGTRVRSFKRLTHSAPLPMFVFDLKDHIDALADRLVEEVLVIMFRKLHPEKAGWNLSLVNLAVTNMNEVGSDSKHASGRDISTMFRRQEDVLRDFRVTDEDDTHYSPLSQILPNRDIGGIEPVILDEEQDAGSGWLDEDDAGEMSERCLVCGLRFPHFAMAAHEQFHDYEDHP